MSSSSSRLINLSQNTEMNPDTNARIPTRDTLKDKLNQQINGPLSSSILRTDEDEVGKTIVKGNVLNKRH